MSVKVYSTPSCSWCVKAKDYLKSNNISFEEYDVSKDRNAATEMVSKSGQRGVPVLDINDNIIVGFDKKNIDKLLGL
ncbi:NrdH-redoxin [Alkalibaculum sp. M08DMB]|uniref:NrdH-redoxin n=1 Tax=Alkalibaculum sporogenes TaxID=2655001 RepID=A0A6A7KA69_9FIRM|nr:glutaredoxin family protein [Alkalibaculum sporogenes]MPW26077.1 NrdH-redoxin [Alkalibaculum sporogenes]